MTLSNSSSYLDNTKASIELLGMPNILMPFAQHTSSPRTNMVNHHLSQTMVINQPEFNKIFTGTEYNFGQHVFNNSAREFDCEIVAIVPKYHATFLKNGFDNCPEIYVIVLTLEPNGVRNLDYFTINRYFMGNNGFGFIPEIENIHRIQVGEILDKGTVITHSPALKGNQYCIGTNLNIIYGSFPETIEDAFVISESAAKKLETVQVSRTVINCRMDRRPLNLNGDEGTDKFLPDIGSYVRPDGALCGFRPIHWTTTIADADPAALREILPLQDDIMYIEAGAKIVDITFNINLAKMNDCYEQARQYVKNNTDAWKSIYATYVKYKGKFNLTPRMSTLITTAIYRMITQGAKVHSLDVEFAKEMRNFDIEGDNGQVVDFLQAIVHYTVPRPVSNGSKITDLAGSKGVVGKIYPDSWMPVDEYGIRADMMIDMTSPVARNNPGQFYETGINRISEFVRRKCQAIQISQGSQAAFETLMDWYNDVNPNYAKRIREVCLTDKDKKGIVKDAIETSPKIWIPPFLENLCPTDIDFWNALRNIRTWAQKWEVKSTPVTYTTLQADGTGKEFTTTESFAIGSKYIIHLHKIPEITAPGPASVNHIGIPTKPAYSAKNFPVSTSPYKYGEDEFRVISIDTSIRELNRFQNLMSNSPKGVTAVITALLLSENPTQIKRVNISNGELSKTSAVLRLFHSISATLGVETKNTKINPFEVPDEIGESIWETDILDKISNPSNGDEEEIPASEKRTISKKAKLGRMWDEASEGDDDEEIDEIISEEEED